MVLHRRFLHTTPAALRKVSFVVRISNQPGSLENVLRVLRNVNLTRIESRPTQQQTSWDVFLDAHVGGVGFISERDLPISDLANVCLSVDLLGRKDVPWFPRQRADLDAFTHKTLDAGSELGCDHPGFTDQVYRDRRAKVVSNAKQFRGINGKLPNVDYSVEETNTWTMVYTELKKRFPKFACQEFLQVFQDLEQCGLYTPKRIPQLQDLSPWLESKTGFTLRPVGGLLSARDFLNGLAVKTFHSTQYIRHSSKPFYTPEPDVVHELMGHVPMLGNPEFAALSHDIGLASLGGRLIA